MSPSGSDPTTPPPTPTKGIGFGKRVGTKGFTGANYKRLSVRRIRSDGRRKDNLYWFRNGDTGDLVRFLGLCGEVS